MSNHCVYFDGKKRTLLGQSSGSHPPATVFRHLDATEQHNSFFVMFFYLLLQYHCHETQGTQSDFDHYWTHRCELHLQCQASTTDGRCLLCVQAFMHYCISIVHIWMEWKVQVRLQRCFLCEFATAFFVSLWRQIQENWGKIMATFAQDAALKPGKFAEKNDKMIYGLQLLHVLQDTYVDFLLNWECSAFP